MQMAMDMIGYDELRAEQAAARAEGRLVGIGMASFTEVVGGRSGSHLRHCGG